MFRLPRHLVASCLSGLAPAAVAQAVDLSVASFEITQGLQSAAGDIPLIARNATLVRVKVSLNGATAPVAGVDALLRIYANGIEIPESPVYSSNGPILAPVAPSSDNAGDTINFHCLPPEGADIDFVVTVNPFGTVAEDNPDNNQLAVNDRAFLCRRMVDLAYVPVNYTPGGGQPNATIIEPGSGDAFLRAIYRTGDWNYHRSPLPAPTHVLDINISTVNLLNTLNDIRQNQIPAAGYARPEFIYGWLPGNPFTGNGQANGTPGAAAFGNTDPARYQRTFAHEIGHCWGQAHNTLTTNIVGWDIEHHLRDPLGLAALMPSTKRDVMVAGLNTADAWVAPVTYLDAIGDARAACAAFTGSDGDSGGGPADDAASTVLRIAGAHDHAMRRVRLSAAMEHGAVAPTADDPRGNVLVEGYADDGTRLASVRIDTRSCRESCAEPGHLHRETALYANLPLPAEGAAVARVLVREWRAGQLGRPLAEMRRSAHAPEITAFAVARAGDGPLPHAGDAAPGALVGPLRANWSARDLDGDALVADLLYSPDGGHAWFPVAVGIELAGRAGDAATGGRATDGSFEFDASDLPASRGAHGRFAVRVSDGLRNARRESNSSFMGVNQPPDVHLLTPNNLQSFAQGSTVILHGSAWDIDEQLLPESSVTWTSSLDGPIGTGRLLARRNLSVGTHVLTVRGTDAGGLFRERSVTVTVTARDYNNGNLNGQGTVAAQDLIFLLSEWGGTGIGDMDLDGVVGASDIANLLQRWGM